MTHLTEEQVAALVVAWMRDEGWDVYQEVAITTGGDRADIVGVRGPVLHVVEVKTSMSLALITQGLGWLGYAHQVSIAAPRPQRGFVGASVAIRLGLGVIAAGSATGSTCLVERAPPFTRTISPRLKDALREEHRTFAPAGNASSRFYSPWRATCDEVRRWVAAHPGGSLRDCIAAIKHHYRGDTSARAALAKWIEGGQVAGVRLVRDGRAMRLELRP